MKLRVFILTFLFVSEVAPAWQDRPPDKSARGRFERLAKSLGSPTYTILNINNFTSWVCSDAPGSLSPTNNNQGYYPRGTGNVIYTDGIYWGAKAFTDANLTTPAPRQTIRVGGKGYGSGLRAGWVNGFGASATVVPPTDPNARVYRIRRDYKMENWEELRRDAADVYEVPIYSVTDVQIAAVLAQYDTDWKNWPVNRGAPYIERNGVPGYQAPPPLNSYTFTAESLITGHLDEPGIAGADPNSPADQVIWTVANDLDPATTLGFQGSEPLGLELQFTIWGYKSYETLGQMFFRKVRIINKGGVDTSNSTTPAKGSFWLDSVFVGTWTDGDLGAFSDDLAGCDTTLQLGFYYNANSADNAFEIYGYPPPSIGYAFLQGPILLGAASDSAVFNFSRVYGKENLPLSSFWHHGSGLGNSEPCNSVGLDFYNCNTCGWWKLLRGFWARGTCSSADIPLPRGPFPVTKFPYSGDPITGSGFLDGLGNLYSPAPGDRRFMLNTGPFSLAPSDTQEIVLAVVAGLGADRLSSVGVMKYNTRFARRIQRGLFSPPRPPASPTVKTVELDRQIILEWGSNPLSAQQTEQTLIAGEYQFEGYNVYQLRMSTDSWNSSYRYVSEAKKIAAFDIKNGVTTILDLQFDYETGLFLLKPVQSGQDAGVQRSIKIARDYLQDKDEKAPLNNGEEYYFAVTAYNNSVFPDAAPRSLESVRQIIKVKPRIPFGIRTLTAFGDTLTATHTAGSGTGAVMPIVIDPLAGTGDTYEVRFDTTGGTTTWSLRNTTQNTLLLTGQTNQSGDENYPIVEGGIWLKVRGPNSLDDVFTYVSLTPQAGQEIVKESVGRVGVFPNPYYGGRNQETTTWRHFVTFNNLPPKVKIYIFNLAGHMVRMLEKNDPSQFLEWDLTNKDNWQVGSGVYICYVEMPDIGETKVLKLAIIQPQLFPGR